MSHDEVAQLLPWYVNATLDEGERRAVEDHLPACGDCARELEQLRGLAAALTESATDAPRPDPRRVTAVLGRIDGLAAPRPSSFWDAMVNWWGAVPRPARLVLAVQLGLIIGLSAWGMSGWQLWERESTARTVAGPADAGVPQRGARIVVAFSEGASEGAIRKTLLGVRGTIVAGPSALGLYTVELPLSPEEPEAIERVLQALRDEPQVVRFAAREF